MNSSSPFIIQLELVSPGCTLAVTTIAFLSMPWLLFSVLKKKCDKIILKLSPLEKGQPLQ